MITCPRCNLSFELTCKNCGSSNVYYDNDYGNSFSWVCGRCGACLGMSAFCPSCRCLAPLPRGSKSCFLTEACCTYKGLPEDCYELETLRAFRDTYMESTDALHSEVDKYYELAPRIVQCINVDEKRQEVYELISSTIDYCIECINECRNEEAYIRYKNLVNQLSDRYLS